MRSCVFAYLRKRIYLIIFLAQEEKPKTTERPPSCYPSPCGPNSQCQMHGDVPSCSCLPNYIGQPPNCRPECVISSECSSQLACINQRCKDPCPGSCGTNANCHVLNHLPICTCAEGHTGDPFTQCNLIVIEGERISHFIISYFTN